MKIFNSLGSNYSWEEARELMKVSEKKTDTALISDRLRKYLRSEKSEIYWFYKAREALEAGCRMIGVAQKGKWAVAVNGFTCYVVERAVRRAGGEVVFVDLGENQLNFDLQSLRAAHKKNPSIKAVVLQNTFGLQMTELSGIIRYCRAKKLVVIEDCAHNMGANYEIENGGMCGEWGIGCGVNGPRAGSIGDIAVMSWSQDKTFDVVSGGCLVINDIGAFTSVGKNYFDPQLAPASNERLQPHSTGNKCGSRNNFLPITSIAPSQIEKDRKYAIRTWWVRHGYGIGIGKLLHWWLKKKQKLSNPMQYAGDDDETLHELTPMAGRGLKEKIGEAQMEQELARRRRIAMIYYQNLAVDKRFWEVTPANIQMGVPVRYPVKLKSREAREKLVKMLEKRGFYLRDVWYDVVAAPARYFSKSSYKKKSCPRGEKLAEVIFNLPTHKNISEERAEKLAELVEKLG